MGELTLVAHLRACAEAARDFAAGLVSEVAKTCSDALEEMDTVKQDKLTGESGQLAGFDTNGELKAIDNTYLDKNGGTMTGTLILSGDPINGNDAASKDYVDNADFGIWGE